MSKRQLIDDIRRYNTTAQLDFLAQFDEAALKQYLEHLEGAFGKRIQIASWVRKQPKLRMVSQREIAGRRGETIEPEKRKDVKRKNALTFSSLRFSSR